MRGGEGYHHPIGVGSPRLPTSQRARGVAPRGKQGQGGEPTKVKSNSMERRDLRGIFVGVYEIKSGVKIWYTEGLACRDGSLRSSGQVTSVTRIYGKSKKPTRGLSIRGQNLNKLPSSTLKEKRCFNGNEDTSLKIRRPFEKKSK